MNEKTFLAQIASLPLPDESDPVCISGFLIECRTGAAFDPAWWDKAVEQGEEVGRMPALVYQIGNRDWIAQVYAKDVTEDLWGTNYVLKFRLEEFTMFLARRGQRGRHLTNG